MENGVNFSLNIINIFIKNIFKFKMFRKDIYNI